jgi:predicted metal-binding membrane protein
MSLALLREQPIVAGALAPLIAISWTILVGYADWLHMVAMPMPGHGGLAVMAGAFTMWALMMMAMMTPSAVPMVLLHARVAAKAEPVNAARMSAAFIAGYLALWIAFAFAATLVQELLTRGGAIDAHLSLADRGIAGTILIAAGIYQWTPVKHACLARCRGPVDFLSRHWHDGVAGAFRTGFAHAVFCLGCCWALMLILFVGGVMNLVWIALLTAVVLAEKIMPAGGAISRAAGVGLVLWGVWLIVSH